MHLFLTDRLTCPRCGPDFGLILLAQEVMDQRVLEGDLGCSNCRENYPVRGGFADLRIPPRSPLSSVSSGSGETPEDSEETLRVGAFLGVTEGPGTLLFRGPVVRLAQGVAKLVSGVEIVALESNLVGEEEAAGVSRMVARGRIPFFSDTFRGILLSGEVTKGDLEEAARTLSPLSRLVLMESTGGLRPDVEALGLKVLLEDEGVLIAEKERSGSLPLVTLRGP